MRKMLILLCGAVLGGIIFVACGTKRISIADEKCIPNDAIQRIQGYVVAWNDGKRNGDFALESLENTMREIYNAKGSAGQCDSYALKVYKMTIKYRGIPKNHRQEESLHREVRLRIAEKKGEFLP